MISDDNVLNVEYEEISLTKMKTNGLIRGLVIIGSSLTSSQLIAHLSSEAKFVRVILSEAIELQASALKTSSGDVMPVSRGAFLTSPQHFDVPEFRTFWNKLWTDKPTFSDMASRNPWLASYFRTLAGCDVGAAGCWESAQGKRSAVTVPNGSANGEGLGLYIWYDLKATAVMAALLKRLHGNLCGASSSGVCPQLIDVIRKRTGLLAELHQSNVSLSDMSSIVARFANVTALEFDASGDALPKLGVSQYTVYNFQADGNGDFVFKQVGVLSANNLTLDVNQVRFYSESGAPLSSQMTPAQCDVNRDCVECQRDVSSDVIFMPGDFYIVAVIPLHSKHTTNSLTCGDLKTQAGADLAEAIIFAVKEANKKSGIFRNVLANRRVGFVVLNSCSSPLLVRQRLLDLHSGRLTLPDGRNTSFLIPDVMGYVGAYSSGSSMAAASTLTDIDHSFVQVSVVSTSIELKDRTKYPYFMRLVPADDTQAKVLLELLEGIGASYFQVIYDSSTAYATGLYQAIQDEIHTGKYDVCVAQAIPTVPRDDSSQYRWIIDRMRTASFARTVIIILHLEEINKTLDAIVPLMTSNDGFIFIATDTWGRRQFLIDRRSKLEGSLILSQEIAVDKAFETYFESVEVENSPNTVLKYFWEKRLNCYFDKSFLRGGKSGPCPQQYANDYIQDFRAPLYINAVYSLVLGFNQALATNCGNSATRKCQAFTSAKLVEAMKEVNLDLYSTGRQVDVFDSNGDGLVGYKVLQVARDLTSTGDSVIYKDVGDWTQEGLRLKTDKLQLPQGFKSACPNPVECNKCTRPSPESLVNNSATGVTIGARIGVGIGLILVVIVLVIALIISCRRLRSTKEMLAVRDTVRFANGPQRDRSLPIPPCAILQDQESSLYDLPAVSPQNSTSNDSDYPYLKPCFH